MARSKQHTRIHNAHTPLIVKLSSNNHPLSLTWRHLRLHGFTGSSPTSACSVVSCTACTTIAAAFRITAVRHDLHSAATTSARRPRVPGPAPCALYGSSLPDSAITVFHATDAHHSTDCCRPIARTITAPIAHTISAPLIALTITHANAARAYTQSGAHTPILIATRSPTMAARTHAPPHPTHACTVFWLAHTASRAPHHVAPAPCCTLPRLLQHRAPRQADTRPGASSPVGLYL